MQTTRGRKNRASLIAIVPPLLLGLGVLGFAFADRSLRSARTAARGRDRVVLDLLVDSAAEELVHRFREEAARPGGAVSRRLQEPGEGPTRVTEVAPTAIEEDVTAAEAELGGSITLVHSVDILRRTGLSADPREVGFQVRFEVSATLTGGGKTLVSRVRAEREGRVVRTTLPSPLDQAALLFYATRDVLPRVKKGTPVFAGRAGGPRALIDLLTQAPPEGLLKIPRRARGAVRRALDAFSPDSVMARATAVVGSVEALRAYLETRRAQGLPVSGLIHLDSNEPLPLSTTDFSGRCVIVCDGPIEVGEIQVLDPARDHLTLVSRQAIQVFGRRVMADLVSVDAPDSMIFTRPCVIEGTVLASTFPRGPGLSPDELGECRIGPGAVGLVDPYLVVISPVASAQQHRREGEPWTE